jgi:hypothetical protein
VPIWTSSGSARPKSPSSGMAPPGQRGQPGAAAPRRSVDRSRCKCRRGGRDRCGSSASEVGNVSQSSGGRSRNSAACLARPGSSPSGQDSALGVLTAATALLGRDARQRSSRTTMASVFRRTLNAANRRGALTRSPAERSGNRAPLGREASVVRAMAPSSTRSGDPLARYCEHTAGWVGQAALTSAESVPARARPVATHGRGLGPPAPVAGAGRPPLRLPGRRQPWCASPWAPRGSSRDRASTAGGPARSAMLRVLTSWRRAPAAFATLPRW